MNNEQILAKLNELNACEGAVEWVGSRSLAEIWNDCENRDWMFWFIDKINLDRKSLVLIACECARLAMPYVKAGETRPLAAIEIAERWAKGDPGVTIEMVMEERFASYAAAEYSNASAYAAYAAYAAAAAASYANTTTDATDAYAAKYAAAVANAASAAHAAAAAYAAAAVVSSAANAAYAAAKYADAADADAVAAAAAAAAAAAVAARSEIDKKCIEILKKYVSIDDVINGLTKE